MTWTGLAFGDAWPYLAAGYGVFFAALTGGVLAVVQQRRSLKRRAALLEALQARRG